jgi:type 2 lantibiotic biosynthesis protein LanM
MSADALRANPHPLSDQERLAIARGATPLFERLAQPCAPALISAREGRDLLTAWSEAFSPGDARAFARRLGWDGRDEALVLRALTEPKGPPDRSPEEHPPAWTAWLNRFLEEAATLAKELESPAFGAELERLTPSPEPPFLEVWACLVRSARRAVADAGESLEGIQPAAYAAFERGLVRDLSAVGEMVLYQLFREFKSAPDRPSAPCYPVFVRRLLEGSLATVFKAYPVMARHLSVLVATWVRSTLELLTRLRRDRDALAAAFGLLSLGEVCRAAPAVSDRHDGGRCVAILTFSSGRSVVYKPRDVGLERAFQEFLSWLSSRGLDPSPPPLRIVEREGYGWTEFVDQEPFADRGQVAEYFRRAGSLLAIVHVLRGTDAHQENVVATRSGPVLIDAEMLLQPVDRGEEKDARGDGLIDGAAHGVPRSCLSSGFVTLLEVDGDGASYDVGGLMPASARTAAVGERSWRGVRSDDLHYVRALRIHPAFRNQVVLDGVVQMPEWFAADVLSGFAGGYRFLLAERPRLLDPEGPLSLFATRRSRILFRPSEQYGLYLHLLNAPRYQKRGLDRSLALETLNRVFRHEEERPRLWPLVAEERQALEELDVPRHLLAVGESVLTAASGERVSGYLVRSGLDAVRCGISALSEEDLEGQLDLLGSALDAAAQGIEAGLAATEAAGTAAPRLDPAASWVRAAELIGDLIVARGRRGAEGTLSWSDCDSRGPVGRYDLYRGQAGVGLFLAALAAVTGQVRFSEAASSALRPLEGLLSDPGPASPSSWRSLGACSGLGSVVYVLASVGRLLHDPAWTGLAFRWAREISPARIEEAPELDVAGGTAGALLALLALDDGPGAPWIGDRVRDCVRRLLETQVTTGEDSAAWPGHDGRPLAGFAHGAAGIAYALGRVYARTGEAELREAVGRAHRHERRLFSPAVGNWPVAQEGGALLMTAWCHGAPGIGLARALGLDALRDDEILEEVRVALETTAKAPPSRADHLCCGDMGRSEALLTMGRCLGDAGAVVHAEAAATRVAARVFTEGRCSVRTEGFEHRTFHAGFFRGLAGVGYQLLRTAAPSRLPSILGFESAPRMES